MSDRPCDDVIGRRFSWRTTLDNGPQAPVLLLHGLTGSRWSWAPQLARWADGRTVAAWDAPGYGASAALSDDHRSWAGLAAAVVAWADDLGVDRFHLVGLSFGGMIAQYTAALFGERVASLSLLATSPKFGLDGVTTPESWRAARLAALDAGQQPRDFAPQVLRAISGPGITAAALADQIRAADLVGSDALRTAIDILITHDSRDLLPSINAPTVCLVGELDEETPLAYSAAIAELIPGARVEVVAGAGHLLNAEAPDEVNRLLGEHLGWAEAGNPPVPSLGDGGGRR